MSDRHRERCDCGHDHTGANDRLAAFFKALLALFEEHEISGIMVSAMVKDAGHAAIDSGVAFDANLTDDQKAAGVASMADELANMADDILEPDDVFDVPTKGYLQ